MRELDDLAGRFWAWRARQQPRTRDDIPRLARPPGWLPETDPDLAGRRHEELEAFRAELGRIRPDADAVPDRVDHRLLRSAIARVTGSPTSCGCGRSPASGPTRRSARCSTRCCAPAWTRPGSRRFVRLLRAVPATLAHAPAALAGAAREFAGLALAELDGIRGRLDACADALAAISPAGRRADLRSAAGERRAPSGRTRAGWPPRCPGWRPPPRSVPSGTHGSCARSPACRSPWARSTRSAAASTTGPSGSSWCTATATGTCPSRRSGERRRQCAAEDAAEASVRAFYEREDLLSQPAGLGSTWRCRCPATWSRCASSAWPTS